MRRIVPAILFLLAAASALRAQDTIQSTYTKQEVQIPMRDGKKLFTSIYTPKDTSQKYPILMCRTPYSVGPYGQDKSKEIVGPTDLAMHDGFIVVYQDVRGCYLSEGTFVDVRPHIEKKTGPTVSTWLFFV